MGSEGAWRRMRNTRKQDALYEYEHYHEAAAGVPLGRGVFWLSLCKGLAARVVRVAESLALRSAGGQSHKVLALFAHDSNSLP